MNISKQLSIFTHILALVGFLTIAFSSGYSFSLIIPYLAILFLSVYFDLSGRGAILGQTLNNILSIFIAAYLLIEVFLIGEEIFNVLIYFITFIQIIKLLGKKEVRDYGQIILLSFFQLLSGAAITTKISYGVFLLVFIFFSVVAIILFNISNEIKGTKKDHASTRMSYFPFLSSVVVIWVIIILFSAFIFLFMPRLKGNYLSGAFLQKELIKSGFSGEVELGRVGEIKMDSSTVMRVKFINIDKAELPDVIYWRGVALDYFDGRVWKQTKESNTKKFWKKHNGLIIVDDGNERNLARQEIITQPLNTDVVFSANKPVAFKDIPYDKIISVNDSYYHDGLFSKNTKYIAYTDLFRPTAKMLNSVEYSVPENIGLYTDKFNVSNRVTELASELYDPLATVNENVINVRDYLRENMSYTRVLKSKEGIPPLDQFLFENREGHCEYFASSMVVILREMGIPSRIVTGFLGGEFNDLGDYFIIRESDAHAWTEVYFPEYGWVSFDPTPSDNSYDATTGIFMSSLEYMKYRWNKYIVDFDSKDQNRIYASLMNQTRGYKYEIFDKNILNDKKIALLIGLALFFCFLLYRYKEFGLSPLSRRKYYSEASNIYLKTIKMIKKEGFTKPEYLTTTEFSNYVSKNGGDKFKVFSDLTSSFNLIKYGGVDDAVQIKKLREYYKNLSKEISEKNKS